MVETAEMIMESYLEGIKETLKMLKKDIEEKNLSREEIIEHINNKLKNT